MAEETPPDVIDINDYPPKIKTIFQTAFDEGWTIDATKQEDFVKINIKNPKGFPAATASYYRDGKTWSQNTIRWNHSDITHKKLIQFLVAYSPQKAALQQAAQKAAEIKFEIEKKAYTESKNVWRESLRERLDTYLAQFEKRCEEQKTAIKHMMESESNNYNQLESRVSQMVKYQRLAKIIKWIYEMEGEGNGDTTLYTLELLVLGTIRNLVAVLVANSANELDTSTKSVAYRQAASAFVQYMNSAGKSDMSIFKGTAVSGEQLAAYEQASEYVTEDKINEVSGIFWLA